MVVTDNSEIAEKVRILRDGGQKTRYDHQSIGVNSRLDELQAAILRVKLTYLDKWNRRRRHIAALYTALLGDSEVEPPIELADVEYVYHLYVVCCEDRDPLREYLAERDVGTAIHYPTPIHLQGAYRHLHLGPGSFPIAERHASRVMSLPIYPELTDAKVRQIAACIRDWHK